MNSVSLPTSALSAYNIQRRIPTAANGAKAQYSHTQSQTQATATNTADTVLDADSDNALHNQFTAQGTLVSTSVQKGRLFDRRG